MLTGFWRRNLREGDHLEDRSIDGRIILKWIFKTWHGGIDWIDLAQVGGCCECRNELSFSIKWGNFLSS